MVCTDTAEATAGLRGPEGSWPRSNPSQESVILSTRALCGGNPSGPEHQLGLLSAQWTPDVLLRAEELSQAPATSGSSQISKRHGTKLRSHLHRPVSGDTGCKRPLQWDRSLGKGERGLLNGGTPKIGQGRKPGLRWRDGTGTLHIFA